MNQENGMNEMHGKAAREAVVKLGCRTMKAGIQEVCLVFPHLRHS